MYSYRFIQFYIVITLAMAASARHIVKHWKKYTLCSVVYFFGARFAAKRHRSVHFSFQCTPGRDTKYTHVTC